MHLVHYNYDYRYHNFTDTEVANKTEGLAVLGVFIEVLLLLLILLRRWRLNAQHTFNIHTSWGSEGRGRLL